MCSNEFVKLMLSEFPETHQAYDEELKLWHPDIPSIGNVIGKVFYPLVVDKLRQQTEVETLVKLFNFMELMALSSDVDVKESLMYSLLECLGDDRELLVLSYSYMGESTRELSDKIELFLGRVKI